MTEQKIPNPEDKTQVLKETLVDGEEQLTQLSLVLERNNISTQKIGDVLSLDVEYGPEIIFARHNGISSLMVTEPKHANNDIPDYTEEGDYGETVPVTDIHDALLDKLDAVQKAKVRIIRNEALTILEASSNAHQQFDLITLLNVSPHYFDNLDELVSKMLAATKPGGVVLVTLLEPHEYEVLEDLKNKLKNHPNIEEVVIEPVKKTNHGVLMNALGSYSAVIKTKKIPSQT